MSKPKIIKELKIRNPNINKRDLEKIFELFLQEIIDSLLNKKSIEIRSLGTFFIKEINCLLCTWYFQLDHSQQNLSISLLNMDLFIRDIEVLNSLNNKNPFNKILELFSKNSKNFNQKL